MTLASYDADNIIRSARLWCCRYWEYPFSVLQGDVLTNEPLNILDTGSGWSLFPMYLSSALHHKVTCVDLNEIQMKKISPDIAALFGSPPEYRVQDLTNLEFEDNHFDRVFCVSVLEHIEEELVSGGKRVNYHKQNLDVKALGEMFRVLKPGGILMLTIEWSEDENYGRPYRFIDVKSRLIKPFMPYLKEQSFPDIDWETYKINPRKIWREKFPFMDNMFMSSMGIVFQKA
ncbi:class I SAM-dependent methyltransferase [Candidatus Sumerlaeota bacterium]|nr:class I SAM-dependent methyltransferase [Candidatus Sumerlaeota bacterium]